MTFSYKVILEPCVNVGVTQDMKLFWGGSVLIKEAEALYCVCLDDLQVEEYTHKPVGGWNRITFIHSILNFEKKLANDFSELIFIISFFPIRENHFL